MYSSIQQPEGPLTKWMRQHVAGVLVGGLVAGYLLLVIARHMGYASFNNIVLGIFVTAVLPNLYRWREIGSLDPEAFIDALLRVAAIGLALLALIVLFVVFYKHYPRPHFIWADATGLAAALLVAWWGKRKSFGSVTLAVFALTTFWIIGSAAESVGLQVFVPAPPTPAAALHTEPMQRIGLALSGGGFRAATVHAGALHALQDLGVEPTNLATVSGGSIIGAYFAMGGTPLGFRRLLEERQFHLKRELFRFTTSVRLVTPARIPFTDFELFPWTRYNRADSQQAIVRRLVAGDADLSDVSPDRHLMVVTTDLVAGEGLSATREGYLISPRSQAGALSHNGLLPLQPTQPKFIVADAKNEALAKFVVASGAFPMAFPAIPLNVEGQMKQLADGGIVDNTGIGILLDADYLARRAEAPAHWQLDVVIASDGGQLFRPTDSPSLLRFVDIIHSVSTAGFAGSRSQYQRDLPIIHMTPANFLDLSSTKTIEGQPIEESLLRIDGASDRGFVLQVDWDSIDTEHMKQLANTLLDSTEQFRTDEIEKTRAVRNQMNAAALTEFDNTLRRTVLNAELKRCIATFLTTSTLDDQLDLATIDELYRLGQYMVYLRWPDIAPFIDRKASL